MKTTTLTLISLAATTVAHAQWQAFDIHPPGGYTQSFCNMTDGARTGAVSTAIGLFLNQIHRDRATIGSKRVI